MRHACLIGVFRVLTILAKVVEFTARPEEQGVIDQESRTEYWRMLSQLLEHWKSSVSNKGFMEPTAVFAEDGQAFPTLWFTRGVCGENAFRSLSMVDGR